MPALEEVVEVRVRAGARELPGTLIIPPRPLGVVAFAHGSGSSRHSTRNQFVAARLRAGGLATLLFDLLTEPESQDRGNVFDIPLLAGRVAAAVAFLRSDSHAAALPVGLFGASTGAAAALVAAAADRAIGAVVSRGGRPDLAGDALPRVAAPTLLIVGGDDHGVIELNQEAFDRLRCAKRLDVVPGAGHLFEEPGMLEAAAVLAREWFVQFLGAESP